MDAMVAEQFHITPHQFGLAHSGKKLALLHAVHLLCLVGRKVHFAATASHRTGRDEDDFHTHSAKFCQLVHQCRHAGKVKRPVLSGKHIAAHLYGYSIECCHNSLSLSAVKNNASASLQRHLPAPC